MNVGVRERRVMAADNNRVARTAFETSDLNLASYLRCRGFEIEDVKHVQSRMLFTFADSPALRRTVLDYANDGPVGVRSFCNTLRDLKALSRDVVSAEWLGTDEENQK